jgi:hypothetical protein
LDIFWNPIVVCVDELVDLIQSQIMSSGGCAPFPGLVRQLPAKTFARHILRYTQDDSNMEIPLRLAPGILLN